MAKCYAHAWPELRNPVRFLKKELHADYILQLGECLRTSWGKRVDSGCHWKVPIEWPINPITIIVFSAGIILFYKRKLVYTEHNEQEVEGIGLEFSKIIKDSSYFTKVRNCNSEQEQV